MSKNLEELKEICSKKTKDYSPANICKEEALIKTLESFEKRIKELEKHNLGNSEFVVRETYFPNQGRKKVLE